MGWIVQEKGTKGSLKWIQHVVNERPDALNMRRQWCQTYTIDKIGKRGHTQTSEKLDKSIRCVYCEMTFLNVKPGRSKTTITN